MKVLRNVKILFEHYEKKNRIKILNNHHITAVKLKRKTLLYALRESLSEKKAIEIYNKTIKEDKIYQVVN